MEPIFKYRLVPAAVVNDPDQAVRLTEALLAGGLGLIEITLRTPAAERCIAAIRKALPSVCVGAGTILQADQIDRVVEAGAQFGVAPGLNETVVRRAGERRLPLIPGVLTPSEIDRGIALGCPLLKFFPAEAAGGVKLLQALSGPFAHTGVKFVPTGGIEPSNLAAYLALPTVAAVGGSWMVDKRLVAEKNWAKITALTTEALALAGSVKG